MNEVMYFTCGQLDISFEWIGSPDPRQRHRIIIKHDSKIIHEHSPSYQNNTQSPIQKIENVLRWLLVGDELSIEDSQALRKLIEFRGDIETKFIIEAVDEDGL